MSEKAPAYKRILLKLSGEALMGDGSYGIDPAVIRRIAEEVRELVQQGIEVGMVIGGGCAPDFAIPAATDSASIRERL